MPCRPSAPSFGHRSRGNWLLLSISSARGAISWLAKSCTVSRIASAVSPRSKLNIRCALGIMVGLPPGISCGLARAQPYALEISLSRGEVAEKGHRPDWRSDAAECSKLALALARATGCNSVNNRRPEPIMDGKIGKRPMPGTIDLGWEPHSDAVAHKGH